MLSRCPFDISAGVGAFVIGLSQTFLFLFVSYVMSLTVNPELDVITGELSEEQYQSKTPFIRPHLHT